VGPEPTALGELMECHGILLIISKMPQGTAHPGSSYIRLGSVKLQSGMSIRALCVTGDPDS
jgi:hypothetical protein